MNSKELIQSLVKMLDELPHRDIAKLDALVRRAEMIIRRVFGDSSKYLKDLERIDFSPMVYPAQPEWYKESWNSGTSQMRNLLNTMTEELELSSTGPKIDTTSKKQGSLSKRVFVVHGHDEAMKQAIARILEILGLEPIILHEKPHQGRTIIEKFTDYSDVAFAVVLLSPDDLAYPKDGPPDEGKLRARQNVIFELGFFIGKLGRDRVLALYREDENFEMPSDYSGVLYTPYDKSGRRKFDVVRELKACGYPVDANKLV